VKSKRDYFNLERFCCFLWSLFLGRLCGFVYQSNQSFNIHPRAIELLKIGLFKFPPLGAKKPFKCPTNKFWNTSPQRQISSSIKHCSHFSETVVPWWHLQALFPNKGEILSCKSIKPCKNQKTHRRMHDTRTRDKSGSNSPPFQGNVQIPPFPDTMHSQTPRVCPGVDV